MSGPTDNWVAATCSDDRASTCGRAPAAHHGQVEITQGGQVVDPSTAKEAIRLRRTR